MKTAMLIHDAIRAGSIGLGVAGGIESMSNAPYLLDRARGGYRMGHGRVLDHILGNKAVFKSGANVAGDVAFAGSAYAADEARRRKREGKDADDAEVTAFGLGVLGLIGKVASAATQAQADTRQWDNLPQHLSFAALKLPPGEHTGMIEFLDRSGAVLERRTQSVRISVGPDDRDTVVFLSELKR